MDYMTSTATRPEEYIQNLPEDRKEAMNKLRKTILKNLPKEFTETLSYCMIGYVVPHEKYPAGYHCDPKQPLPFVSIASQKKFIAFYHMGIYAMPELLEWFTNEYPKHSSTKLDMARVVFVSKNQNIYPINL